MTEAAFLELLAGFEQSIKAASRSLTMARALAESHRSGLRPPDIILDAYLATVDRDEARLVELRQKAQELKSWFSTHRQDHSEV